MNERLIQIFLELIKIDGLSGNEKEVADYIIQFLRKLGLNPITDNTMNITGSNTGNVICEIGEGGDFVLLSHMDTARSTQGIKPVIQDGVIKSDGTTILGADNRAGISSILYAVEQILVNKIPHKNFTVAFVVKEETDLSGSQNIVLPDRIKRGFIFDSHLKPGNFVNESVGAIGFEIDVYGKAAHSGLAPETGIDAIKIASNAISKIQFGRIDSSTTANIGKINGGTAINVVPPHVKIIGEVRSEFEDKIFEKYSEIKNTFETCANELGGKVEISYRWDFKPYKVSEQSQTYIEASEALRSVGLNPKSNKSFGGSDANSLNAKGIVSINFGIGAENPHSNDEYIYIDDLIKGSQIAYNLIKL